MYVRLNLTVVWVLVLVSVFRSKNALVLIPEPVPVSEVPFEPLARLGTTVEELSLKFQYPTRSVPVAVYVVMSERTCACVRAVDQTCTSS